MTAAVGAIGALRVQADLSFEVDGVPARLHGDGDLLVLQSDSPQVLWDSVAGAALPYALAGVNGPRGLGKLADGLASTGLRLEIRGPRGTVASLGAGVRSPIGRLVTGSASVSPGTAGAVAPLLWHRALGDRRVVASVITGAGLAAVWVTRRRRR